MTQAVSRGCGVPTLGAIGDLTAHNPEQPVLADPVLSRVGQDDILRSFPTSRNPCVHACVYVHVYKCM